MPNNKRSATRAAIAAFAFVLGLGAAWVAFAGWLL